MKKQQISFIALALMTLVACQPPAAKEEKAEAPAIESPDYAAFNKKVEVIRSFIKAHENEDLNAQGEVMADTLRWSPPFYNGNEWLGKEDYLAILKTYQENFDNIKFAEGISMGDGLLNGMWAGSVFPESEASSEANAIRVYGTWTATNSETGKEHGFKWYAIAWINDDGKLAQFTEYFDLGGIANQIAAE